MPENGMEFLTHPYPITDALVTVEAPPSLIASVTYAHRKKFDDSTPPESGFFVRPLNGVLLPHQDIRVHWYVKEDVERRKRRSMKPHETIEITPEMIEAGVIVFDALIEAVSTAYLVEQVYIAMEKTRLQDSHARSELVHHHE